MAGHAIIEDRHLKLSGNKSLLKNNVNIRNLWMNKTTYVKENARSFKYIHARSQLTFVQHLAVPHRGMKRQLSIFSKAYRPMGKTER